MRLRARRDSPLSALALAVAAVGLGHALQLANGAYHPDALFWVTVALGLAFIATLTVPAGDWIGGGITGIALVVLGAGLVREVYVHLTTVPGIYMRIAHEGFVEHHLYIAIIAVLGGLVLALERGLFRTVAVLVLCATFFVLGVWMLKASPSPIIDVFTWHKVSYDALKAGTNPWAIFMPNIYGHTIWYAPGLADAQQVKVGYPYPPLLLLLGGIGHVLEADYRYAHVAAYALSGALLAFAKPSRLAGAAAVILFLTPRSLFVIEQGWTEPLALLMFCFTIFAACRWPRAVPYALGLMFAVKQYFVLLAPLTFLLMPGPFDRKAWLKLLLKAAAVTAVLTVPFFLWDPGAFWRSVVEFQGRQPFRVEALSYVAATAVNGQPVMPLWLSFPAAVPGIVLGCVRAPKTPAAFAAASALTFLLFFAFAKQAFCNYYFMIVGMLCAALAVMDPDAELDRSRTP